MQCAGEVCFGRALTERQIPIFLIRFSLLWTPAGTSAENNRRAFPALCFSVEICLLFKSFPSFGWNTVTHQRQTRAVLNRKLPCVGHS